ncbi:MAG: hypothetical protein ABRQ23_10235 [Syntrophomonadaceae bacterium]
MFGAITGDIIGSPFDGSNNKRMDFVMFAYDPRFTDDTVLTVAIADSILKSRDYALSLRDYGIKYR